MATSNNFLSPSNASAASLTNNTAPQILFELGTSQNINETGNTRQPKVRFKL